MAYRVVSQAGLEDLLCLFIAAQLNVKYGLGGEISVEVASAQWRFPYGAIMP